MKTFSNLTSITIHKGTHIAEKSYHECAISKEKFSESTDLAGHARRHRKKNMQSKEVPANDSYQYDYECDVCEKRFSKSRYLSQHQKIHTGKRPHGCEFCDKRFLLKHHLQRHKVSVHPEHANEKPYECEFCGKIFSLKHHLKRHKTSLHSEYTGKGKPRECWICQNKYWNEVSVEEHSIYHSRQRMLLCSVCGNEVFQSQDFQETDIEKSNDDQYDCNKCEERFSDFRSLIQHHAWQHGASYRCDVCQELDARCLTDIGYVCLHCDTVFDSSTELVKHMDTHGKAV
jgi:KRAB domain-containing zinc finger protein